MLEISNSRLEQRGMNIKQYVCDNGLRFETISHLYSPLKNPTALSGCAQRKQPHFTAPDPESKVSTEPPMFGGHIWKTSKYPECLSSLTSESWSLAQGKALVTTVKKVLFSHLSISQQCLRLATCASLELRAWEWRAWNNNFYYYYY